MPSSFLIRDLIETNDEMLNVSSSSTTATTTTSSSTSQPTSPITHSIDSHLSSKRPSSPLVHKFNKRSNLNEQPQQQQSNAEKFMNSLIAIANHQQQQQYSALYLSGSESSDYLSSPQSSSSSSSSSTSPPSTSSTTNAFTHEQLVNQFYQQLFFLNIQNSLNRIQTNGNQTTASGAPAFIFPKQIFPTNKENNNEQDYNDEMSENELNYHNRQNDEKYLKTPKFHHTSTSIKNKKFSTSSLKATIDVNELDESCNSDHNNGTCSTPVDTTNSTIANTNNVSPLDALLQMANTTFVSNPNNLMIGGNQQLTIHDKCSKLNLTSASAITPITSTTTTTIGNNIIDIISSHTNTTILNNKLNQNTENLGKRKRKNRTAFTAHQIYELEKRFSHQKYLSPSDRDRIAQELSLSTAQVITWFQNRRAKQKRDVEEMKNDLLASKSFCGQSSVDDQLSNCSFSLQQQHKIYSNNNSVENDCHSDSDISLDSPNTSLS